MSGHISVVGLGPGPAEWITPEASAVLARASDLVGYAPYIDRVPDRPGLAKHASGNRVEIDRAGHALRLAAQGRDVAVVSGGDPGVFAMAAAIFEAIETGDPAWRALDVAVVPGVTAMLAAAARLGAPLGHDFCAISLSDNLKPWDVIARRLAAAATGDFVAALYNPVSRARPHQLGDALAILASGRAGDIPVAFARAIGRPDERILVATLDSADPAAADMSTLVLVGSSETRRLPRGGDRPPWLYTPRTYGAPRI